MGCGGCLSSLRRTRAGRFDLEQAGTLEQIQAAREAGTHEALLRSVASLFDHLPALTLRGTGEKRLRNGGEFPMEAPDGRYRVYGGDGEFLLLGQGTEGTLKTVKRCFEVK